MDLDAVILDYERYAHIGCNDIFLEAGISIPVRREHIARDPTASFNRIVNCDILGLRKHDITGEVALHIKADGYAREPYIGLSQVYNRWEEHSVTLGTARSMVDVTESSMSGTRVSDLNITNDNR